MIYFLLAAAVFTLDIFFKNRIEERPDDEFPTEFKNGVTLEKHHNYGFMFNRLEEKPGLVKLASVLTMVPLLFWALFLFARKAGRAGKLGVSFLLGGAASNVYDRLTRGYVVDYLRLPIKKIRHIIFNIADFFIFLGAAVSAVCSLFSSK